MPPLYNTPPSASQNKPQPLKVFGTMFGVLINGLIQSQPVLPIAMQSGPAASVLAYERQHGLAWNSVVDPDGGIARHFGISATPSFVVLDAQGNISSSTVGLTSPWGLRLRLWRARLAG